MKPSQSAMSQREVIGVIPAGGQASRIAPLPCSKELYPIGFRPVEEANNLRPKVVCHYLLEKMRLAGITKVYMILREGKWDIPAYFGDGSLVDMHLAYLMRGLPFGAPYTLDQAYPFVRDAVVAFGFPDILFQSENAFVQILQRLAAGEACAVLGLFPADRPQRVDMVDVDEDGRVKHIAIKPLQTHLSHSWGIAVWTPMFTAFLHEYVSAHKELAASLPEVSVGHIFQAAMEAGLRVEATPVSDAPYLDIGTPEDLRRAVLHFASDSSEPLSQDG
jgi:glucose-1-phosphate thymidylyltransferase